MPETSVLVINYNGLEHLDECFSSLQNQTYKDFEAVLVDNNSSDKSVEFVKKKFPKVRIVKNHKNYGFAEGNNKGMRTCNSDFIVLLNNDTKVEKDWLKNLVKAAKENKDVGFCASKMVYFDNPKVLNSAGLEVLKNGRARDIGIKKPAKNFTKKMFVTGACGGAALYKKEMLEDTKLGNDFLDSDYFAYYEDADLSLRAQSRGWKCLFVPNAIVHHKEGMSFKKVSDLALECGIKNKVYTVIKNWPTKVLIISLPKILLDQFLSFFYYLFKFNFGATKARFVMLKNIPKMIRKRRIIQKRKKVDISDLLL